MAAFATIKPFAVDFEQNAAFASILLHWPPLHRKDGLELRVALGVSKLFVKRIKINVLSPALDIDVVVFPYSVRLNVELWHGMLKLANVSHNVVHSYAIIWKNL